MELFEDALERVRRRYLFVVAGYVVMPEHVHLLVNEPGRGLLSRTVQALKLSVSMRRRKRPFWQAHYYDFNVSSHEKFVEKLRYIHRNPVRRGLVAKPEDWKWSSFRHYQTGIRETVEIESEWTARERGWQLPEWMRYRQLDSSSPVPRRVAPVPMIFPNRDEGATGPSQLGTGDDSFSPLKIGPNSRPLQAAGKLHRAVGRGFNPGINRSK